ncbi:hypothetical protein ACN08P_08130 [Photobacterium leiognathi subsp. mandapamensis]|uniref:hypothetical protein n=1 Tax=Photobacterium leiognathi TaxID=553611 RepID=UPI003AF40787
MKIEKNDIEEIYHSISQGHETVLNIDENIKLILNEIHEYRKISSKTSDDIINDYNEYIKTKEDINSSFEELKELIQEKDNLSGKIESLTEQIETSDILNKRLNSLITSAMKQKKEVSELHSDIFGYIYEDENGDEIKHEGLKNELDQAYSKLKDEITILNDNITNIDKVYNEKLSIIENDHITKIQLFIDEANEKKEAILEQIKSLLPDALTAGLSGAYIDKIDAEEEQLKKHDKTFEKSIMALIICSLIPVIFTIIRVVFLKESYSIVLKDSPMFYSMMLPVYAPILWVAYTANKSYKLSKRLIEEYKHKEVSSRTFEGLSNQISNIGESDINSELRTKLLFNLLQVNSENPGKLISDYNKSDHPIIDAIDKSSKLTDAINRLDNIPLINPLLKHISIKEKSKMDKKSKEILNVIESEIGTVTEK